MNKAHERLGSFLLRALTTGILIPHSKNAIQALVFSVSKEIGPSLLEGLAALPGKFLTVRDAGPGHYETIPMTEEQAGLTAESPSPVASGRVDPIPLTLLTIVIPARDEEGCIASTAEHLYVELRLRNVPHEIVVVDDGSTDNTWKVLEEAKQRIPTLAPLQSPAPYGFGRAIVYGLDHSKGDAMVIMMADESDDCRDVVMYWKVLNEGYDCVFGSRFVKGGGTIDYPRLKLTLNRLANFFIRMLFRIPLNDTTNAFKAYRRTVIDGCRPFLSPHFNLTIEIPLKAIVRGYSWKVVPITWRNRRSGVPKLKIKEMGSRYLFVCLYVWLEKYFSRGDYRKSGS